MRRNRRSRRNLVALAAVLSAVGGCSLFTDLGGFSEGAGPETEDGGGSGADSSTEGGEGGKPPPFDAASVPDGGSAYVTAVLADGPLAYYPLEGTSGAVTADVIGGANGKFVGTCTPGVAGKVGHGAAFDGTSCRLEMPPGQFTFANRQAYSLELWIKADVVDGQVRRIAHRGAQSGQSGGYELYFTSSYVQCARYGSDGGDDGYANQSALVTGAMTHLVVTYDGERAYLYKDGVTSDYGNGLLEIASQPDAQLVFGDRVTGTFFKFDGVLDEIAIYDKALPAARVKAHFDAAPK
jgi:Concanavalin A-like lectin/glucanases superfamily